MKILWTVFKNTVLAVFASCFFGLPYVVYMLFKLLFSFGHYDAPVIHVASVFSVAIVYIITSVVISGSELTSTAVKEYAEEYGKRASELDEREELLTKRETNIRHVLQETKQSYPWTARQVADLQLEEDLEVALALRTKVRPAYKAAEEIKRISKAKRELNEQKKRLEYQIEYYESVFPWLEEFKEVPPAEGASYALNSGKEDEKEYEAIRKWLSPEEYSKLSNTQRYQLALERYKKRKKNDWEIGIEYERYVGYMYENCGYRVQYHGALMGKQDMGRDLVATKDGSILVIQCKRWAKEKTIHEKHIFQLYGSSIQMAVATNKNCTPVFVTTTCLSEQARKCAEYLHIDVMENYEYKEYPLVKCNISSSGEKIYYLPFDQQYDRVRISGAKGEKYVASVEEAEMLGFRHAYRWRGNSATS